MKKIRVAFFTFVLSLFFAFNTFGLEMPGDEEILKHPGSYLMVYSGDIPIGIAMQTSRVGTLGDMGNTSRFDKLFINDTLKAISFDFETEKVLGNAGVIMAGSTIYTCGDLDVNYMYSGELQHLVFDDVVYTTALTPKPTSLTLLDNHTAFSINAGVCVSAYPTGGNTYLRQFQRVSFEMFPYPFTAPLRYEWQRAMDLQALISEVQTQTPPPTGDSLNMLTWNWKTKGFWHAVYKQISANYKDIRVYSSAGDEIIVNTAIRDRKKGGQVYKIWLPETANLAEYNIRGLQ